MKTLYGFFTEVLHRGSPRRFPRGVLLEGSTEVLHDGSTEVLHGGSTEVLHGGSRGFFTTVLHDGSSRRFFTTVLNDGSSCVRGEARSNALISLGTPRVTGGCWNLSRGWA
jgi:hypothetical protein